MRIAGNGSIALAVTALVLFAGVPTAGAVPATVTDDRAGDRATVAAAEGSPDAVLTTMESNVSLGDPVSFDAGESSDPDGEVVEYRWDFDGDGEVERTTEDYDLVHIFNEAGVYEAAVTVVDDDGNTATATTVISVETPNRAPDAAVTANPSDPAPGDPVTLDARESSDVDGEVVEYRWDFDGDGTADETTDGPVVAQTYDADGVYEPTVTVVDDRNATATASTVVVVGSASGNDTASPTPAVAVNRSEVAPGQVVEFDATNSSDSDGEVLAYWWDFDGDGETDASGETVRHAFAGSGTHEVTLTVVDDAGASSAVTVAVRVDASPTVEVTADAVEPIPGEAVTLSAVASDPDGSVVAYEWDFDGDGEPDGTGPNVSHSFSSAGSHEVTLTVTDDEGLESNVTYTVNVTEPSLTRYAGEDGVVDTDDLRTIITDWARGVVTTDFLRGAIQAWAAGQPVN